MLKFIIPKTMQKLQLALFFIVLSAAFLVSCSPNDPVKYNDSLVDEQSKMLEPVDEFAETMADGDYESADSLRKKILKQAKSSLEFTKEMSAFNGNTTFRDTGIAMFEAYVNTMGNEYAEMLQILLREKEGITDEDASRYDELEKASLKKINETEKRFIAAQKKFAAENNMDLY